MLRGLQSLHFVNIFLKHSIEHISTYLYYMGKNYRVTQTSLPSPTKRAPVREHFVRTRAFCDKWYGLSRDSGLPLWKFWWIIYYRSHDICIWNLFGESHLFWRQKYNFPLLHISDFYFSRLKIIFSFFKVFAILKKKFKCQYHSSCKR